MIVKCKQSDVEKLISYIDKDYSKCLYLYLNLKKYGLDSDIIDAFIQYKDDEISSVMLKYYSCMHIYSKNNDFDADEISDFLFKFLVFMIHMHCRILIYGCLCGSISCCKTVFLSLK